jgi:hypothetical protein
MVGIKAIKARVRVEIIDSLDDRSLPWKKTSRVMRLIINRGTKIAAILAPGT